MSPWGIGATLVILLICAKFWQIRHLVSSGVLSSGVGVVLGGKSNFGSIPFVIHSSLTLCCSSVSESPLPWCVFCARVVGEMHLMSSGLHGSITPAASIALMLSYRYRCCGGVKGF